MPSDPSIIGELRPPAFNSPFQSLGQIYALRGAQQEQQLRQAQIANEQELTRRTKHENDLAQAAGQAQQYTDAFRQRFADPQTGIVPEDKMPALDAFLDQHGLSATKAQMRAAVMDSNKAIETHQQYLADQKAQAFDSVRDLPPDQAVTILGNRFKALGLPDQERFAAIAKMADMRPDQGKQAIQAAVQASPTTQKAVTDRAHSEAEAASARALAEDRNRPPAAPQPTPQTFMIDGRPVRGSFIPTPDGGRYMFNGQDVTARAQPIPPRPAAAPQDTLVKVEHKDPATGKTIIEWMPKSEVRGKTFDAPTNATTATRVASAQAVSQTGNDIIDKLSSPAYANEVGVAMGRYNSMRDFIGNPPPQYAELAGLIESYALANMGVHGMRSASGAEQIKKLLDQKHTPASLISTIKGLNGFASHFMENEGVSAAPSGAKGPAMPSVDQAYQDYLKTTKGGR